MIFRTHIKFYLLALHTVLMAASYGQVAGLQINGTDYLNGDTVKTCVGSTLNYTSTATGYSSIEWAFPNGTPASSTSTNAVVTYNSMGISIAKQKVSNGPLADSITIFIKVSQKSATLNSSFDFSPTTLECASQSFLFNNKSTGINPTWFWNFGDTGTSTLKNPAHIFMGATGSSGTQDFTVTLTATDANNCSSSTAKIITVKKIADTRIGVKDASVLKSVYLGLTTFRSCNNNYSKGSVYNFKFINNSSTIATNQGYKIKWGDGVSADSSFDTWGTGQVIEHTFPFGLSRMVLQIKGPKPDECIAEESYYIFVGLVPVIETSYQPGDMCEGGKATFNISDFEDDPPGTYYRYFVSGLINNTTFTPANANTLKINFNKPSCGQNGNTWKIDFYAINPCGSTKRTHEVAVSKKARAAIQFSEENAICLGADFTVTNATDHGNIITGGPPSSAYSCIKAKNPQQSWVISPSAGYTVTGNLGNFNAGVITNNGSDKLSINFSDTGTYKIKLYISDEICGYDSITRTICVQQRLKPVFQILSNDNNNCFSDTVSLQNTTRDGKCAVNQYLWSVKQNDRENCGTGLLPEYTSGDSTTLQSQVWLKEPGLYNIILKAYINNSCFDTSSQTWVIKGPPKVKVNITDTFCVDNDITPSADTASCYAMQALKYSWSLPGANPDTSNNFLPGNLIYHQTGNFPVILHAQNECGITGDTAMVAVLNKPVANAGNDTTICSDSSIKIGVNTGAYTYSWYPSTGLSDTTVAQPVVSFNYPADTTVTYYVKVISRSDCESIDSIKITVKKSPVIKISPVSTGVCADSSISLTASGATGYTWSPSLYLNNSNTATVISTPKDSVTYTVTGTAANGCKSVTPVTVSIYTAASAAFTPSQSYLNCTSYNLQDVIHTDTATGANGSYLWYINNRLYTGNITGVPPDYIVNTKDTVKLVVQSKYGCKPDSIIQVFAVSPHVKASFVKDNYSGCEPFTVNFTNSSSSGNGIQYDWDFGNGTNSELQQPAAVIFKTNGSGRDTVYYITLKVTDSCGTDLIKDSVLVKALPQPRFDILDARPGCSPDTITFINTSQGNYNMFNWDLGDGTTLNTVNYLPFTNIYFANNPKTFSIVLGATNSCGTDTAQLNLTIAANDIYVSVQPNGNTLYGCAPDTVIFKNATTGATASVWNYGDGTIENIPVNQSTITHMFKDTGTFNIVASFSNTCDIATSVQLVQVLERPQANFEIINGNHFGNDLVVCNLDSVKINITQQTGNRNTITWGDGTGVDSPPFTSYLYSGTGYYNIQLLAEKINSEGVTVCSAQDIKRVKIGARPNAGIMPLTNSIDCYHEQIQLNAYGGVAYSWYPDENIAGTNSGRPYVFPKSSTTYHVDITGASGCKVSDSINVKVAYAELQSNQFIAKAFSPNGDGINDILQVHLPALTKMIDFKVFNRWGKIVFQTKNAGAGWDGKFNGTLQPQEVYNYVLSIVSDCIPRGAQNIKGDIMLLR